MAYFVRWIAIVIAVLSTMVNAMRAMTVVQGEIPAKDVGRPTYRVHLPEKGSPPLHDMDMGDGNNMDMDVVELMSAQGQKLSCSVPNPAKDDNDSDKDAEDSNNFDDVEYILGGYVGQCFLRQEGWWSYEFCYNRSITQFHKAKEPEEEELSFTLGTRDHNIYSPIPNTLPYTEVYGNGTECDVSGRPREVTVKYICADDTSQMGAISKQTGELFLIKSIKEVSTCVYELEFISSAICHAKMYKKSADKHALDIQCRLQQEQGAFRGLKATAQRKGKATLTL